MELFKKVITSIAATVLALSFIAMPVNAAVTLPHEFPEEAVSDYGERTALIIKLKDEGVDSTTASQITTVDITFEVATDFFQPQVIANSDVGWKQFPDDQREAGIHSYDITGQFLAENTYNEIWIKTGFKNAGAASIAHVVMKDIDGKVVYQLSKESTAVTGDVVAEVADTADATDTLPQTGTFPILLYLVAGGALVVLGINKMKKK